MVPLMCKIWVFRIVKLAALASHSQWRVLGVFALSVYVRVFICMVERERVSPHFDRSHGRLYPRPSPEQAYCKIAGTRAQFDSAHQPSQTIN